MTPSSFTYSCRPAMDSVAALAEHLAQAFAAGDEEVQSMAAQLREGPPPLDDIGSRREVWRFGATAELIITRESDWDWHDLRGMFWRHQRLLMEAAGLGAQEHFHLKFEYGELTVSLALTEVLFDRVRRALRAVLKI